MLLATSLVLLSRVEIAIYQRNKVVFSLGYSFGRLTRAYTLACLHAVAASISVEATVVFPNLFLHFLLDVPDVCPPTHSSGALELVEVLEYVQNVVEVVWLDEVYLSLQVALVALVHGDVAALSWLLEDNLPLTDVALLIKV